MKKKSAYKNSEDKIKNIPADVFRKVKRALKARKMIQRESNLLNDKDFADDSLTKIIHWFKLCGHDVTNIRIDGYTDVLDVAGKLFQVRNILDVNSLDDLKDKKIIVDLVRFWDNAEQFFGNILVNSDKSCVAVVLASTRDSWTKVNKWKKRWYSFYQCSADNVLFYKLDDKAELKWLTDDNSNLSKQD